MVSVPGFLLKRLYVKQSLQNTDFGLEFHLKNNLGSGYSYKLWPLKVDGQEMPIDSSFFILDGEEVVFSNVSQEQTFTLGMNKTIVIRIAGQTLETGSHQIEMAFDVPGLGTLRFNFTDVITG